MELLQTICQIIVGLGILNVWLLRYNKASPYRAGEAKNMREEFEAYGLPYPTVLVIGSLKVALAIGLLLGIWYPRFVVPSASGLAILMTAAVAMHAKVNDPPKKSVPALSLWTLSLFIAVV